MEIVGFFFNVFVSFSFSYFTSSDFDAKGNKYLFRMKIVVLNYFKFSRFNLEVVNCSIQAEFLTTQYEFPYYLID